MMGREITSARHDLAKPYVNQEVTGHYTLTGERHIEPPPDILALPCPAAPCPARPSRALPRQTQPRPATPEIASLAPLSRQPENQARPRDGGDSSSGRGQALDGRCVRRPHKHVSQDGTMDPTGAEQNNGTEREGLMPSNAVP